MNDAEPRFPVREHLRLAADTRCGAVAVVNILEQWLTIRSALDLGCGIGVWLRVLRDGGRREVFGVDFETNDPGDLEVEPDLVLTADLGRKLDLHRRFDLVVCLEVAEHINAQFADTVVENCVRHADLVLFSAALPGQQGINHVNEQSPRFWAERFQSHGYVVLDVIRKLIWDEPQIPVWYRQNILLFAKNGSSQLDELRDKTTATTSMPLALAHPDYLRWFSTQAQIATAEADAARLRLTQAQTEFDSSLALHRAGEAEARSALAAALADAAHQREAASTARQTAEAEVAEHRRRYEAEAQARGVAEAALAEVRSALETTLADAARQREAAHTARTTAEAELAELQLRYEAEAQARIGVEAALAGARSAHETAVADAAHQREAAHTARTTAESELAELHLRYEAEAQARIGAEAALAKARSALDASLADAALEHEAARTAREAAQAEATNLRLRFEAEMQARIAAEAGLADAAQRLQHAAAERAAIDRMLADMRDRQRRGTMALAQSRQHLAATRIALDNALRQARDHVSPELADARREIAVLRWERGIIVGSTLWCATEPLRRLGRALSAMRRQRIRHFVRTLIPILRRTEHPEDHLVHQRPWECIPLLELPHAEPQSEVSPLPEPLISSAVVPRQRILFISGEAHTPGHTYRVLRQVEAAARLDLPVSWMAIDQVAERGEAISAASIVIIWRAENSPAVAAILNRTLTTGAKVLFDIDDLMFRPELATPQFIDGIRSQRHDPAGVVTMFQRVQEVAMQVDACICTTEELAQHMREFNPTTFVLPNGFDTTVLGTSRRAVRRRAQDPDGLVRLGYATGTRTHQADFSVAAEAIGRVLRERPQCRLVLFRDPAYRTPVLEAEEFPTLAGLDQQIEWRDLVPLEELPNELARFDINLAPLEVGNPFCEAKSELKYFEAALVQVCTVASPTGPLRRAVVDGETGRLPDSSEAWYCALRELVDDPAQRRRLAHAAYLDVLWRFGPHRRIAALESILHQMAGADRAAAAFELDLRRRADATRPRFDIPDAETIFVADQDGMAEVTVVIPLHNYSGHILEALDSVLRQTLTPLDLVVVDDASTDDSLRIALAWARQHAGRFNRVVVLRNRVNAGLARSRNVGFDAAETPFVLPLDADNRLLPECCASCLASLRDSRAAFAYPHLRCFGDADHVIGDEAFSAIRFATGNYIDAMAMVAKWAWAAVGGYTHITYGWEDYDFWCRCVEHGFWGVPVPETLAEYRLHDGSMLHTQTDVRQHKLQIIAQLKARHAWVSIPYNG